MTLLLVQSWKNYLEKYRNIIGTNKLANLLTKHHRLFLNGGWVLGLNLARQLLGLVLIAVLVRVFNKESFGQYQFVVASLGTASIFALTGMQNAITQSVARGFDGTFRVSITVVFLSSLLGSLVLVGLAIQQWYADQSALFVALLVAAGLFPFSIALQNWISYQSGKEQFRQNAIYQSIGYAASYLLTISVVLMMPAPNYLVVILVTNGVMAIQNVWNTYRIYQTIPKDAPVEAGAITYGLKTSLYGAVNIVGNYMDKFLLFFLVSPETLAVFIIAERIPELLKNYLQAVRNVLVPEFARKAAFTKSMDRKLNLASLLISAGVIFLALAVIPWFIPFAFTNAYDDAVFYCQLLLGSLIVGQAATTKFTYIISQFDSRSYRDVVIGTNIVRIVASLIFVPMFGIYGAIGSVILYRVGTAAFVSISMRKFHVENDGS